MKKYMRMLLALVFVAVLALLCGAALAEETTVVASGTCGTNVTWQLNSAGELTISGTGAMSDYYSSYLTPWYSSNSSILKVTIEDGVTSIGDRALSYCSSMTNVSIPDSVTSIGDSALFRCSSLTSVAIPDSVTSIGHDAFSYCSSLKSVVIPDGVTSIGEDAFYECSSLTSVSIGDGVTSIGNYAFKRCSSLASVSIGDSVTSIGHYAFQTCSSLKEVYISSLEAWLKIYFYTSDANPMYYADKLYVGGKLLTNAVIPDSVTSIGNYAFKRWSSLTSVSIGDSVTSIGSWAFDGCSALKDVYYAGTKAEWAKIAIEEGNECLSTATLHCSDDGIKPELKADAILYLPEETRTIADEAFLNGSFEAVELPEGCETIGTKAFAGCDKLVYIRMPDSVTSIADDAFEGCNVTFICESDNAAAAYAKAQEIEFVIDQ